MFLGLCEGTLLTFFNFLYNITLASCAADVATTGKKILKLNVYSYGFCNYFTGLI